MRSNAREPDANIPDGGPDADCRAETCNGRDDDCDAHIDEEANAECALDGYVGVCVAGLCTHECAPERADCDGQRGNACEVSLLEDRDHCGGCGHACDVTELCEAGRCRREHIVDFATGLYNLCAVMETGRVLCVGEGTYGANGDGTTEQRDYPVEVIDVRDAVQIAFTGEAPCVVTRAGDVWCWGYNENGIVRMPQSIWEPPTRREDIAGATVVDVGGGSACAILGDQTVWCWGHRVTGRDAGFTDIAGSAEQVPMLRARAFAQSPGSWRLAIGIDGRLVMWGRDDSVLTFEPASADPTTVPRAFEGIEDVHSATVEYMSEQRICVSAGPRREGFCQSRSLRSWTPVGVDDVTFIIDEAPFGSAITGGRLVRWPTLTGGSPPEPFRPLEEVPLPGEVRLFRTTSRSDRRCALFDADRLGCWDRSDPTLVWVPGFAD